MANRNASNNSHPNRAGANRANDVVQGSAMLPLARRAAAAMQMASDSACDTRSDRQPTQCLTVQTSTRLTRNVWHGCKQEVSEEGHHGTSPTDGLVAAVMTLKAVGCGWQGMRFPIGPSANAC